MPVKYPCLLWVAFFFSWIFPPQCRWFVPSNCVRPSGAGDFAHTTKKRREGGRGVEVVVVLLRGWASASGGQCVWMRLNSHHSKNTHAPFYPTRADRQEGRQSVSQSVSQPAQQHRAAEKVPAAPLTPKLPEPLRVAAKMDV